MSTNAHEESEGLHRIFSLFFFSFFKEVVGTGLDIMQIS